MVVLARLRDLFASFRTSDGDTRPTPPSVAENQAAHGWIAAWTALGALAFGAPTWLAVAATVGAWGGVWEAAQYLRTPSTRVRRDWLLGDLPAYATGAVYVTITRPWQPTGPEWAPVPGTPMVHTFTTKPSAKAYMQRTGLALGAGELVYSLVNSGVTITPSTSDVLTIDGVNWPVQEVIPMDSAGYVISWMVKVAK